MPKVKICGIRSVEHALVAWEAGADFVGLVFAQSKRHVGLVEAAAIARAVRDRAAQAGETAAPAFVGVFVNQGYDEIAEATEACRLDYVQLHGDESPDFCRHISVPVIKAVRPTAPYTISWYQEYVQAGATLLFDTFVAHSYGGSGTRGDWSLAADLAGRYPLILAGGLDADNVAAALHAVRPWAVDVSSGVETDGTKDEAKIRAFLQAVRVSVDN